MDGMDRLRRSDDERASLNPPGYPADDPRGIAGHDVGEFRDRMMVRRAERVGRDQGHTDVDLVAVEGPEGTDKVSDGGAASGMG
jgi:hypothetical protein